VFSRLAANNMKVHGRSFVQTLQPVAGSHDWFGEFRPVNRQGLDFMGALLQFFFRAAFVLSL
jgi:hypothetical protein